MNEKKTKSLYILLTKSGMTISKLMEKMNMSYYTHSCIAFDRELKRMYSFGTLFALDPFHTGLKKENIFTGFYTAKPYIPVKLIEIPVTQKQYCNTCKAIHWIKRHHDSFKFNTIGMIYSILNIDKKRPNHFFCSEFVYTLLNKFEIADFKKPGHFVLPDDFLKIKYCKVIFDGKLISLQSELAPFHGDEGKAFLFENSQRMKGRTESNDTIDTYEKADGGELL